MSLDLTHAFKLSLTEGYCESVYFSEVPFQGIHEFGNSISSLVLVFTGVYNLFQNQPNVIYQYTYSLLIVNGVGSALFHSTLKEFWHSFDIIPMILILSLSITILYNIVFRLLPKRRYYKIATNLLVPVISFKTVFLIVYFSKSGSTKEFDLLFKISYLQCLLSLIILYVSKKQVFEYINAHRGIYNYLNSSKTEQFTSNTNSSDYQRMWDPSQSQIEEVKESDNQTEITIEREQDPEPEKESLLGKDQDEFNNEIFKVLLYTIISSILASTFWLYDKYYCNQITGYFYLHSLWHIFISYTIHSMLFAARYIESHFNGEETSFNLKYKFIPV